MLIFRYFDNFPGENRFCYIDQQIFIARRSMPITGYSVGIDANEQCIARTGAVVYQL